MSKRYAYLVLFLFSTVIILFVYNEVYYIPQIAIMFLSPLIVVKEGIPQNERVLVLLIGALLFFSLIHPSSFRLFSVVYSILFVVTYISYTKYFSKSNISALEFQTFVKGVIIAYAIVLAIQLFSHLVGIPTLNASYNTGESLKYNSLAFEASQIGPVITVLMYAYIKIEEITLGKRLKFKELFCDKHKKTVIMYAFASIFSFSVTCYLALFVLGLYFVKVRYIISGALILIVTLVVFFSLGTETGDRLLALIEVIPSLDVRTIYEADPSASARIAPPLIFFKELDLLSINSWVGYGCDYGSSHIWHILIDDDSSDENMAVIGIFGFIYDYGIIAFIIFLKFIHSLCKFKSYAFFLYLTCFFTAGFNWASTWLFFMVIYSLNHFEIISKCADKYQLSSQHIMLQKH